MTKAEIVKNAANKLLMLGLLLAVSTLAEAQMAVPGSFAVSPNGAATYTIPIQAPPGIAGIEPKLALSYNSQGGNGQLGVGWALSGLSVITRCPQTVAQDAGKRTGVNFTSSDRFCVDGKRLMLKSGTYGGADSTYGTEIESFSEASVTALGTSGPQSFKVFTRDGLSMEYGSTVDSRIQVVGKTGVYRTWALNKMTDRYGNYLTVSYALDSSNGSYHPLTIKYTANTIGAIASTSEVDFDYDETRSDAAYGYLAGTVIGDKFRLNSITTKTMVAGVLSKVLTYSLSYEYGADTGRSRLTSIGVCDAANTCLPATTTSFSPTPSGWVPTPQPPSGPTTYAMPRVSASGTTTFASTLSSTTDPSPAQSSKNSDLSKNDDKLVTAPSFWMAIDINGDGRVDLAHVGHSAASGSADMVIKNWISNGSNGFTISTTKNYDGTNVTNGAWNAIDVNGDSIGDLAHTYTVPDGSQTVDILIPTCKGTGAAGLVCGYGGALPLYYPGVFPLITDFDGDGLADVLVMNTNGGMPRTDSYTGQPNPAWNLNSLLPYKSNGAGGFSRVDNTTSNFSADSDFTAGQWQIVDVDGNGLLDLVHFVDDSGKYCIWRSLGDGNFSGGCTTSSADKALKSGKWQLLDLNGDGLIDLVHPDSGMAGKVYVWMNKGDGTFSISTASAADTASGGSGAWQVVDFNGDGLWDLIHLADGSGNFFVWQSNGSGGFTATHYMKSDDLALTTGIWKAVAMRGDGVVDLVHLVNDSGLFYVWNLPRPDIDVPSSISNGIGKTYRWTHQTLPQILGKATSAGGAYVATPVSPPSNQTTVVPPLSVVTQTSVSDAAGGFHFTNYNYYSARVERNGYGYVGFAAIEAIDGTTNYVTRTQYAQTFPEIGLPTEVDQGTSDTSYANLSKITNTYQVWCPFTAQFDVVGSACWGHYRYFPFLQSSLAQSWDLDGTPLPKTLTTTTIDGYGNPATITTNIETGSGGATDYSKSVKNTYFNSITRDGSGLVTKWLLGDLVTSQTTAGGPAVPAVVVPGTGVSKLPPTPAATLPPNALPWLTPVLSLLLDD